MLTALADHALLGALMLLLIYMGAKLAIAYPPKRSAIEELNNLKAEVRAAKEEESALPNRQAVRALRLSLVCLVAAVAIAAIVLFAFFAPEFMHQPALTVMVALSFPGRLSQRRGKLALVGVAVLLAISQLVYPSWLTASLSAAFITVLFLVFLQGWRSFWMLSGVLAALVGFMALLSLLQGNSASRTAQELVGNSNMSLMIPSDWSLSAPPVAAMTVMVVMVPGILVVLVARIAVQLERPRLFWAALGGCAFGLGMALLAAYIFQTPQPGLFYVLPTIIGSVWLVAQHQGVSSRLRLVSSR